MTVNIEDLGSPACWGVEGVADQVNVRVIGPNEVMSMKFSLESTVEDVKRAVADTVGIEAIDMTVRKCNDSIFGFRVKKCLSESMIAEVNDCLGLVQKFLGPHLPPLTDTDTLQEFGIVNGSTLVINQKLITQRDVLLDLYIRCGGQNWTNATNWGSERPLDDWYGVTCNRESGAIESIDLRMNNLTGLIPASLGNLQQLVRLQLGNNQLAGKIPASLGNLQQLVRLALSNNQLSGAIPEELGNLQHLNFLYLQNNQLRGEIPASLGNLQHLKMLFLEYNQLSGAIPASLGNLQDLELLFLENNQLSGKIPTSLGNLQRLEKLLLARNQLTGAIPDSLCSLQRLKLLALTGNPDLVVEGSEVIAALLARNVLVE